MSQCVTYIVTAISISFHFNHTLCLVIVLVESLYRRFEGTRTSEETSISGNTEKVTIP